MKLQDSITAARLVDLRRSARSGYTLIEMILVVGVILLLTSLSWSPLLRFSREYRVKESSEEVRRVFAGTRTQALENDVTYQCRIEVGGRRYIRVPYEKSQDGSNAGSVPGGAESGELPIGMTFSAVNGLEGGGQISPELLSGVGTEFAQVGWSGPILFFPDGTATSAVLDIVDEMSTTRRISVRDLTGAVTVATR
jgi:prepilin-type N-terminal cleavage/methylation domain-containing protein